MRHGFLILAGLVLLAGCSMEIPGFLGREGSSTGVYNVRGDNDEPLPDRTTIPMRSAVAERALHGVILRAEGISPTQGYFGAILQPMNGGAPDAAGIISFALLAYPPLEAQAIGPERTRTLRAAYFFPNLALRDINAFRVTGGTNTLTLTAPRPPVAPPVLATDIPRL